MISEWIRHKWFGNMCLLKFYEIFIIKNVCYNVGYQKNMKGDSY